MKPTVAKSKGRMTENIWVGYLHSWGLTKVERRRLMGSFDQGDISGWDRVCTEVKSGAKLNIPGWLKELDAEIVNSKSEVGYLTIRPKGLPKPEDWYIVLRPDMFMTIMKKAGYL
jgi:hypothetical protein